MARRREPPPPELPFSLHKRGGWQTQWERVSRWRVRVHESGGVEREDFLYAFFQNCASFRDWIRANRPASMTQRELEDFVRANFELRLCQDISNGTKHFALNDPKMPREFAMAREYVPAPLSGGSPSSTQVVFSEGAKHNLVELVDRCFLLWSEFLGARELVPRA